MEFEKKLKIRLWVAVVYIILGIAMMVTFSVFETKNEFLSSFGFPMILIGIVKVRSYLLINKNQESIIKRKIIETDERNITIANKARSISFISYIIIAGISVIVLNVMGKTELATAVSSTVCLLILIYWISYWIISKKI